MTQEMMKNKTGERKVQPQWISGECLKEVYPELEAWKNQLVTKAFIGWQRATGVNVDEPQKRDERFPDFLLTVMLDKQKESCR
ncbi:hypothetical protein [Kosakonia pseudosacchari]|uniref:hypothetical protein n=1 Tax=Kosakonia pseudosacchari TaxID=1646340 RepID=UPI00187EF903|nr:hypothetical protein [Kosakonia pseudosacchari]QOV66475.1 hypothetical protein IP581_23810 [Kosakonia pseudosacchari]